MCFTVQHMIDHYPTLEMLADYHAKLLQVKLFRKLCKVIMGIAHVETLREANAIQIKECVNK